jgi:Zn-dependent protease with chaperone function
MRFFEQQAQARAQTMRLLLLFVLTLVLLLLLVNLSLALLWRIFCLTDCAYPDWFFSVNTGMVLLFVLGGWWIETSSLDNGGLALARRVGAREAFASRPDEQRLINVVSESAIAASMKPPTVMLLERVRSINAFACGWDLDDAVVTVTRGALDQLTRDELQGLVAHELSHIREGDMRLNMRLVGMVFGLEMIFNMGRTMCEPNAQGRRTVLALPGLAVLATGALGWLAGRVLKAAVSRQREFLADARAVQFTRSRDGLGGVLRKAAGQPARLEPALYSPVQHMLLLGSERVDWFASHPPLSERIRRIYGRPMPAIAPAPDTTPVDWGH